ncbi:aminopeptidase N-like [Ptychodera flava]|uniref:aminopeptidase N-like n=1 Tax=Ptychodera flava TaxID=63121 RepID=UPI003969DC32
MYSNSQQGSTGVLVEDVGLYEEKKKGCFISRAVGVTIIIVVVLVIGGAATITYFAAQCDQVQPIETTPDPYEGLPRPGEEDDDYEEFDGRIPDTLTPINYVVKITPYFDEEDGDKRFLFDGELNFEVRCEKATREVKLHIYTITVDDNSVEITRKSDGSEISVSKTRQEEKYDFYIIETTDDLVAGETYIVSLKYEGTLLQPTLGLYLSTYMQDGVQRYLAATQLQSVYARRMFPCFDEPNLKATFDMIIKYRRRRHALANMHIIRNETDGDWMTSYYARTVKMSTYLNAIVVSEFSHIETYTRDGVLFRVWCRPDMAHTLDYSLMVGATMTDFYGDLAGIPYDLDGTIEKMDMAAIPQFSAGAMENWGLILYREERMLFDEDVDLASKQQRIARIIGHEIVHQWFGNLVTCGWWSDLWLNEGFARFMEDAGVHDIHPEWNMYQEFYPRDAIFPALHADSISTSSRPVVMDVGWNTEISSTFDRMSYEKGGCLNMMMMSFLGNLTLSTGLKTYLNRHEFEPAFSEDLFTALTEADATHLETDVNTVMDTWVRQAGYPVITVTRNGDNVHAEQQHFLQYPYDEPDDKHEDLGYLWYVPLTWTDQDEQVFTTECAQNRYCNFKWMNRGPADFTITTDDPDHWFIVNINQDMFYRVNYENENWENLAMQLRTEHTVFPIRNRGSLISDAFNIGQSQMLNHVVALKIIEYLTKERSYNAWLTTRDNLRYTHTMLWRISTYGHFEKYLRHLNDPIYSELGWDFKKALEDDHIDYHNRVIAVELACKYGNQDCVNTASEQFTSWMAQVNNSQIREDTKDTVYCTAVRYGGDNEWVFAFDQHLVDEDEKGALQRAMACSRNTYTLQSYMEYYLETNETQSVIGFVRDASGMGFNLAWNFVNANFDSLHSRFGDSAYDTVWSFANTMNTARDKQEMEDFGRRYADMPVSAANNFYDSLQKIEGNIEWMDRNAAEIKDWLVNFFDVTAA